MDETRSRSWPVSCVHRHGAGQNIADMQASHNAKILIVTLLSMYIMNGWQ